MATTADNPLIAIITPAYNAAPFILDTIKSVQDQTYPNWEMIIVDDGSSDSTYDLVAAESQRDPRIKPYKQKNAGPAGARITALTKTSARYLCFLDSDDIWLPDKLETQLRFMQSEDVALSFTQFRRISQDGKEVGRLIPAPAEVSYRNLLTHNVIACLTAMIDTKKTGPLTISTEGYDDFILWLSILKKGYVAKGIQRDLARYRIVGGSVSSKRTRALKWVWNIYRKVENINVLYSVVLMIIYVFRVSRKHRAF